jgi:hypothetical protein
MVSDNALKSTLLELFSHHIGFYLSLDGDFYIRELEGQYAVGVGIDSNSGWEEVFDEPDTAIGFYLSKRKELKLGEDLERENVIVGGTSYEHYSFVNSNPTQLILVCLIKGIKRIIEIELTQAESVELAAEDDKQKIGIWNPVANNKVKKIIETYLESVNKFDSIDDFKYALSGELKVMI